MRLFPIQLGGVISEGIGQLSAEADGVLAATSELYDSTGYTPPWICYVAIVNDMVVGTCGFKGPPIQGRVEIAYFTFPAYEGKGIASQMARQLVSIARDADSQVLVAAQTLPERNASHRVLEKLGFSCVGSLEHPEDGTVLEWHLTYRVAQQPHAAIGSR
jgi:[ribosomal protein S5]-alanine N-acetyltransferase